MAGNSVLIILGEGSVEVNIELEVEERVTKLGVDKLHLVLVEVLDQVWSTLWIEPEFRERLEVNYWWLEVVNNWRILFLIDNTAV